MGKKILVAVACGLLVAGLLIELFLFAFNTYMAPYVEQGKREAMCLP